MDHSIIQLEAVRRLRGEITMTDFGLPTGIYRLDILPFHDYVSSQESSTPQLSAPATIKLASTSVEGSASIEASQSLTHLDDSEHSDVLTPDTDVDAPKPPKEVRIAGFIARDLQSAFMPLSFHEGYPAFENGDPFWLQLVFEPSEAFQAFQAYLQMSATTHADGIQHTPVKATDDRAIAGATGFRSIALLAAELAADDAQIDSMQRKLCLWSELFYWDWRTKAYDHFRVARHRQQQEIRAIETQDSHYGIARRLTAKILEYIDDNEDFIELMTPKTALDALKLSTTLERVSAGLHAAGPNKEEGERGVTSMEMTMRRIGKASNSDIEIALDDGSTLLQEALQNPEDLAMIQEFILKVQKTS